jgi:hypothetical protein
MPSELSRRALLLAGLSAGCGGISERCGVMSGDPVMHELTNDELWSRLSQAGPGGGVVPWHMWGSTQSGTLVGIPVAASTFTSGQLVRVNYSRPDTWSFLLWVKFFNAFADSPVAINIQFNLLVGIGRSVVNVTPFKVFQFTPGQLTAALINSGSAVNFATQIQAPTVNVAAGDGPNNVATFPGQDIQISASVGSTGSINNGNQINVEVGAFVAPRTHVRPDWFCDEPGDGSRFRGNEQGGM